MTELPPFEPARLDAALQDLGLEPNEALADLTAMLELMAVPGRLPAATRYLSLEWLSARDAPILDNRQLRHRDLLAVICRTVAIDVVTDLRPEDAAALLNVKVAEVVSLANEGRLWFYDAGRGPRIPTWQLVRDSSSDPVRLLGEGLAQVITAIPDSAVPSLVRRIMTTEDERLRDSSGRPHSPADWIARGLTPWPVIAILLRVLTGSSDLASPFLFSPDRVR